MRTLLPNIVEIRKKKNFVLLFLLYFFNENIGIKITIIIRLRSRTKKECKQLKIGIGTMSE